ncbi:nicotinate-nucleotide adenylyltransferase [Marinobacterium arenosum]|uniref:nicotinate-nucleotide adenylyltransferase n=1 Tax=Marinobacterium arenosum TaxID=2862496 RepID=UPI001C946999|nr:nicotinate-nucleotide adenylyltransferase [Marinobacterium arenosum]MBY4676204.1 nicotinate-nucleotide adenylyltransferase [Marinobacterium arenosum]
MNQSAFVFMGGTFDPVHHGHLRTALEIQQWLAVDQVCLIPSKMPVHRGEPGCSSEQRLAMVQCAVADTESLSADPREILSEQPSYSLLTLQSLRDEFGPQRPICMVMGMDAFLTLPSWHNWRQFMELCHILVVTRPGYHYQPDADMRDFMQRHQTDDKQRLLGEPAGCVLLHELTPLAISATQIRQLIRAGLSPRYLLPDRVWDYIKQHQLYGYRTN